MAFRGAVLAGGHSTRMGRDKATIRLGGRALVVRCRDALDAAGADQVDVVGGNTTVLADLGICPIPDVIEGAGPLSGLVAALERPGADLVVVLACDLVDPRPEAIRTVVECLHAAPHAAVAAPDPGGRVQWLHAAWRCTRAAPVLRAALDGGERAIWRAAGPLVRTTAAGIDERWLRDADVPGDLGVGPRDRDALP